MTINIMYDDDYLKLEIKEDSLDANMNALDRNTRGLSGMRHCVQAIDGHFEILSEHNKGMFIYV